MRIVVPPGALVVLVGPAGSGKTTFARRHFRETEVVSSDRCRAMISDDESDMSVSGRAFELFHEILRHRLELGRVAVADSTAVTARARAELRALARRCGAPVVVLAFDVPLEVCLERNGRRSRRVAPEVVERQFQLMRQALERIPGEGYDAWYVLDLRAQEEAEVEVLRARPGGIVSPWREPETRQGGDTGDHPDGRRGGLRADGLRDRGDLRPERLPGGGPGGERGAPAAGPEEGGGVHGARGGAR
ncbi:MAG: AAA family ATPase [bacterium]